MPKSRTIRVRKRKADRVRNILMWFVCCGRKSATEEYAGSDDEIKMQKHLDACTLDDIQDVVSDKDANGGTALESFVPKRPAPPKPKRQKRRAPAPPQEANMGDVSNETVGDKTSDPDVPEDEKQLHDYPEHLNPFAEDNDDCDADMEISDAENEDAAKQETDPNTNEDYPDELNPFADDVDDDNSTIVGEGDGSSTTLCEE